MLFRAIELPSDEPVQYVGCYVLRRGNVDQPSHGFIPVEDEYAERGLTLATLCDMVLGEEAEDRSDDALIKAVGELLRKVKP